jgi:competence protein ComEC
MMFKKYLPIIFLAPLVIFRFLVVNPELFSTPRTGKSVNSSSKLLSMLAPFTDNLYVRAHQQMASVPANLLLGMTVGIDSIKKDNEFYEALITTGLVHVVVVSGYNVSLVITFINSLFKQKLHLKNRIVLLIILTAYVIVCGAQAPVIRAACMGYIAYMAKTQGRALEGIHLLIVVCLIMLMIWPDYLISISFWLSTAATFGLMIFEPWVKRQINSLFSPNSRLIKMLPLDDLCSSLACQITVWPIISYFMGRISIASPLYNMFLLWLIPICTVLGFVYLGLNILWPGLSQVFLPILLPFYDTFARGVRFFADIDKGSVALKINLRFFSIYYICILLFSCLLLFQRYKTVKIKVSDA